MSSEKKDPISAESFYHSFLRHSWVALKVVLSSLITWCAVAALIVAIFSSIVLYMDDGVRMAEKTLPFLKYLLFTALALNIIVLIPMALIRSSRPWVRKGLLISSIVFAVLAWLMGILLSWIIWDGIAVILGLIMMGIGVVPVALFATAFNERWGDCGLLILALALTFGLRKLWLLLRPPHERR